MTTVEILYRYASAPTEPVAFALAALRDVYGIRRIQLESTARTLLVEYDATRLNAATVSNLVRCTGLELVEELSQLPPQPEPAGAEKA